MEQLLLEHDRLPDEGVFDLLNRDAALWLVVTDEEIDHDPEKIAALVGLPWRLVFIESTASRLKDLLTNQEGAGQTLATHRGFIHVIASDPSKVQLPKSPLTNK